VATQPTVFVRQRSQRGLPERIRCLWQESALTWIWRPIIHEWPGIARAGAG